MITRLRGKFTVLCAVLFAAPLILAVIMIIYAGFRYVTSGGSDEGVKAAKNTILYAIVGLVIVALAQLIVHFVINKTSQASSPCRHGHIQGGPSNGASC
jgi:ABC-type Fe3+ transport system permease subunit